MTTTVRKPARITSVRPMASSPGVGQPTYTNSRTGQQYTAVPAPGGTYHVYADGHREFVRAAPASNAAPRFTPSAPAAPAAPPAPGAPPPDTTGQVGDYKDAAYFAAAAANQQRHDAGIQANDAAAAKNLAAKTAALNALAEQQPRDEQNTRETNNNQGLFWSGHLGQDLSDLASKYTAQRNSANQGFTDAEAQRLADRAALDAQLTADNSAAGNDAIGRAIALAQGAAQNNQLAPPDSGGGGGGDAGGMASLGQAAATARARPKAGYSFVQDSGSRAGQSYNVVVKDGKRYRFYANGDKVLA